MGCRVSREAILDLVLAIGNRPAGLTPHERRRQERPFSCMYST